MIINEKNLLPKGFKMTTIEMKIFMNEINTDPEILGALNNDMTKDYYKDCIERRDDGRNSLITFYGFPGKGKSLGALFNGEYMSKVYNTEFNVDDNIFWDYSSHTIEVFKKTVKDGSVFMFDDVAVKRFGIGSGRFMANMKEIMNIVLRKKRISLIFVYPERVIQPFNFYLRTIAKNRPQFRTLHILQAINSLGFFSSLGVVITGKPSGKIKKKYETLAMEKAEKYGSEMETDDTYKYWEKMAKKVIKKESLEGKYARQSIKNFVCKHYGKITGGERDAIVQIIVDTLRSSGN